MGIPNDASNSQLLAPCPSVLFKDGAVFPRAGLAGVLHVQHMGTMDVAWGSWSGPGTWLLADGSPAVQRPAPPRPLPRPPAPRAWLMPIGSNSFYHDPQTSSSVYCQSHSSVSTCRTCTCACTCHVHVSHVTCRLSESLASDAHTWNTRRRKYAQFCARTRICISDHHHVGVVSRVVTYAVVSIKTLMRGASIVLSNKYAHLHRPQQTQHLGIFDLDMRIVHVEFVW